LAVAALPAASGLPIQFVALPSTGFVRQSLLLRFVPFSKSTLWRRVKTGDFPSPVKLSSGITAWRAEDLHRWIAKHAGQALRSDSDRRRLRNGHTSSDAREA